MGFSSFQVNAVYLEKCIDKLSEEELMDIKVQITRKVTASKLKAELVLKNLHIRSYIHVTCCYEQYFCSLLLLE